MISWGWIFAAFVAGEIAGILMMVIISGKMDEIIERRERRNDKKRMDCA